ncbi:hypothetical protein CPB83DRAFT_864044 [Crepidotus variabilis]|uniref:Uncharacterized protein n=1 Tax=Crepidotus variabilis TaxID=179855 RepID=A0A9P6JJC4_9AGAR|nr:hypothetical protein CPB83DRAFT_864044 [Crepidotus variabilis]
MTMFRISKMQKGGTLSSIVVRNFKPARAHKAQWVEESSLEFQNIYDQPNAACQTAGDNWKLEGGIVGIVAKMCIDSLLRDKLFEKGILALIIRMLDINETRHVALLALSTITQHGGIHALGKIAVRAPHFIILMRDHPDDEKIAELGHCTRVVTEGGEKPERPDLPHNFDMVEVLKSLSRQSNDPTAILG